jgi:hypothetical protein
LHETGKILHEIEKITRPGFGGAMPEITGSIYKGLGKLKGMKAVITGGDSGIGAVSSALACRSSSRRRRASSTEDCRTAHAAFRHMDIRAVSMQMPKTNPFLRWRKSGAYAYLAAA